MKPLYKQEVYHLDNLYSTSKAHKSQVIRTMHSETKSQVLSLQLRGRPHWFRHVIFFNCVYYFSNFQEGFNFICNFIGIKVNNHHFRVFSGSWSYVINKVFSCCTWMASNFNWTGMWNSPTIHAFYHGITNACNVFLRTFIVSYLFLIFVLTTFIILLPSKNCLYFYFCQEISLIPFIYLFIFLLLLW